MAQPIRVLIADDSAHARDGLRSLLLTRPQLAVVGEATNGEDAVRRVAEWCPDIVLMDLQMPVMDGLQATRLIKARWPSVTVIVLTMHAEHERAALAAGADAFAVKGGTPGRLLEALGVTDRVAE